LWLLAGVALVALIFRSTPFFNAMSIFGIALGVTVLITVQSVMNGFQNEYERVFVESQGHLDVSADGPNAKIRRSHPSPETKFPGSARRAGRRRSRHAAL